MVELRRGEIPRIVVPFAASRLASPHIERSTPRIRFAVFTGRRRIRQAANNGFIIVWYSFSAG